MSERGTWWRWGLAALVVGAAALAVLRGFGAAVIGPEAPAYAGVASQPQGASALFGAYGRAGLRVVHGWDVDAIDAALPAGTAAFVIAPEGWDEDLDRSLDDFVLRGGWLVLAGPPWLTPAPDGNRPPGPAPEMPPLERALDAALLPAAPNPPAAQPTTAPPVFGVLPAGTAPMPVWNPAVSLRLSPGWTPLFTRGGKVYMAMRTLGQGTVVLASEPGFLSNDALARGGDAKLLAWLAGGRGTVFADESGHGLANSRGILWLIQRYRLVGALLLLFAALGLLLWNLGGALELAAPAPPPDATVAAVESGGAGLVRLLQRAVPAARTPAVCRRLLASAEPERAARLASEFDAALATAAAGGDAAAVAAFNRLQAAWNTDRGRDGKWINAEGRQTA